MIKFIIISALLAGIASFTFAGEIDSIKTVLKGASHDSTRAFCLQDLGMLSYLSDPALAKKYWEEELAIAERNLAFKQNNLMEPFLNIKATALVSLAFLEDGKGTGSKANLYNEEALKIFQKLNNIEGESITLNNLSFNYMTNGNNLLARKFLFQSVVCSIKSKQYKVIAQAYHNIALTYKNEGNIMKAIEFTNRALIIRDSTKNKPGIAESFFELGVLNVLQKNIPEAKKYFLQSLEIRSQINDYREWVVVIMNWGI